MGDYERGVLDGFEVALYLHRRHFETTITDVAQARRALVRFRREASLTVDAMKVHRLRALALFMGFDDVWTPERAARLYRLVNPPDAGEETREVTQNVVTRCAGASAVSSSAI